MGDNNVSQLTVDEWAKRLADSLTGAAAVLNEMVGPAPKGAWPFDIRGRLVEGVKDFHDRAATAGFAVGAKQEVGNTAGQLYDAATDTPTARADIQQVLDLGRALLKGLGGAVMLGRRSDPDSHRFGVRKTESGLEIASLADGSVVATIVGDFGKGSAKVKVNLDGDENDVLDLIGILASLAFGGL